LKGSRQDELDILDFIKENASDELSERLREVTVDIRIDERDPERLISELYRTLISLRLIRINQALNQLRFLQEDENSDLTDETLQAMVMENMRTRGKLDQALNRPPNSR